MIRFHVLTIFPEVFPGPLGIGVVGRAIEAGDVELHVHDLRDAHRRPAPPGRRHAVRRRCRHGVQARAGDPRGARGPRDGARDVRCILLSPQGRRFDQGVARELAARAASCSSAAATRASTSVRATRSARSCRSATTCSAAARWRAMAVIEATARLVPGVVGSPELLGEETFSATGAGGGFEAPLYTRPADFEGHSVPAVLREGNHAAIAAWRRNESDEADRAASPRSDTVCAQGPEEQRECHRSAQARAGKTASPHPAFRRHRARARQGRRRHPRTHPGVRGRRDRAQGQGRSRAPASPCVASPTASASSARSSCTRRASTRSRCSVTARCAGQSSSTCARRSAGTPASVSAVSRSAALEMTAVRAEPEASPPSRMSSRTSCPRPQDRRRGRRTSTPPR